MSRPEATARFSWDDLSDEELLEANFDVEDPRTLENLLLDLPRCDDPPIVELEYNTKSLGQRMRCVHCKYDNHFLGFVLRFGTGERILVGKDCGEKIYEAVYSDARGKFTAAKDRRDYLARRRSALAASGKFLKFADGLLLHPSLPAFRELRKTFNKAMPKLWRLCVETRYHARGELSIDEKYRDLKAEVRREEQIELEWERAQGWTKTERVKALKQGTLRKPGVKRKPIVAVRGRPVGQLPAPVLFSTREAAPDEGIRDAVDNIKAHLALLAERLPTGKIRERLKAIDSELEALERQIEGLRAPFDFFEVRSLELVCAWANSKIDGESFSAHLGELRMVSDDREASVGFPNAYEAPATSPIAAFKAAIAPSGRLSRVDEAD